MQQLSHLIKLRRQVERRMKGAVVAGGSFKGPGEEVCSGEVLRTESGGGSIDSTTPFGEDIVECRMGCQGASPCVKRRSTE